MNEYFGFRNLRQFEQKQHEVRLPCDLLNDERFRRLADAQKAHLICLLLLAARMGNLLPNRPAKLGSLIGATPNQSRWRSSPTLSDSPGLRVSKQARQLSEDRSATSFARSCWCAMADGAGGVAVPATSRSITSCR
jgi:hypothetical protein